MSARANAGGGYGCRGKAVATGKNIRERFDMKQSMTAISPLPSGTLHPIPDAHCDGAAAELLPNLRRS